jgi:hypothetical protein
MNPQIASFIRTLFKVIGTALAAHGYTSTGNFFGSEEIVGAMLTLVGVLASHNYHKTDTTPPTAPPTAPALVALLFAGILFTGCATFDKYALQTTVAPAVTNQLTGAISAPVTNYAPAPNVVAAITTAQQVAPLAPAPFNWILQALLSLAGAGLGTYAVAKTASKQNPQN